MRYAFAFVDRLYGVHFHLPERDAYNAYLAANYVDNYTYDFPQRVWMYKVLILHPDAERSEAVRISGQTAR